MTSGSLAPRKSIGTLCQQVDAYFLHFKFRFFESPHLNPLQQERKLNRRKLKSDGYRWGCNVGILNFETTVPSLTAKTPIEYVPKWPPLLIASATLVLYREFKVFCKLANSLTRCEFIRLIFKESSLPAYYHQKGHLKLF